MAANVIDKKARRSGGARDEAMYFAINVLLNALDEDRMKAIAKAKMALEYYRTNCPKRGESYTLAGRQMASFIGLDITSGLDRQLEIPDRLKDFPVAAAPEAKSRKPTKPAVPVMPQMPQPSAVQLQMIREQEQQLRLCTKLDRFMLERVNDLYELASENEYRPEYPPPHWFHDFDGTMVLVLSSVTVPYGNDTLTMQFEVDGYLPGHKNDSTDMAVRTISGEAMIRSRDPGVCESYWTRAVYPSNGMLIRYWFHSQIEAERNDKNMGNVEAHNRYFEVVGTELVPLTYEEYLIRLNSR